MLGRSDNNIDNKGRLSIPSKMREELGAKFVVFKGLDHCLNVYPMSEWQKLMDKIAAQPLIKQKQLMRFFCEDAQECELDKQGRFCLSKSLREYAYLTDTATLIGMRNTIEIWNADKWDEAMQEVDAESVAALMEEMAI